MDNSIFQKQVSSRIQKLEGMPFLSAKQEVYIKREDEIHKEISGNKWRKLKYNIEKAIQQNFDSILTFGGAFSNHIAATAAAGRICGIKTIGLIRGEKVSPLNSMLQKAMDDGMELHFISREEYRLKGSNEYVNGLRAIHGRFLHIPEGGSNYLGVNGCVEILDEECRDFDLIVLPVGTAGTFSGVALSLSEDQDLLGFSALKGVDYQGVVKNNLHEFIEDGNALDSLMNRISIKEDAYFGGFARINAKLMDFIRQFKVKHSILLDPIYTGKMMYAIYQMLENGELETYNKILVIHTGGLQGIAGFEERGLIEGLHYTGK